MDTVGSRLRVERERQGLSLRDLAERVDGLDYTAISRIENGRRIASHELFNLAEALGVTTGHLLGVPGRSQALIVAARLSEIADEDGMDHAVTRMSQVLEMDDLLTRVVGTSSRSPIPDITIPDVATPLEQGIALAQEVRQALGLGDGPVPDMTKLLEERFGAHVIAEPVDESVAGVCAASDGVAVVIVNTSNNWARQRFTLAHELAHLIFQDLELFEVTPVTTSKSKSEKRADSFAAYFLAPDEGLRSFVGNRTIDAQILAELMDYFEMSKIAMIWRLRNAGLINSHQAKSFESISASQIIGAANLGDKMTSRVEERENVRVPPRRLLNRALRAYEEGTVGLGLVASIMGEDDLRAVKTRLDDQDVRPRQSNPALSGHSLA